MILKKNIFITKKKCFYIILLLSCIISSAFIYNSSYEINGTRFFCLFDDAMVSMRYAKNLANGYGLVWNPNGEHVEGFTNPLWTLFMAFVHILPLSVAKTSLIVQIISALLMLFLLYFVNEITNSITNKESWTSIIAVTFTAFYAPLNYWGLHGMEVTLLTLLVIIATFISLKHLNGEPLPWYFYLVIGLGTMVRIDGIIPFILIISYVCLHSKKEWKKIAIRSFAIFFCFIGAQTIFRILYFNDIVPNTYHLKLDGYPFIYRIARGFIEALIFFRSIHIITLMIAIVPVFFKRNKFIYLPIIIFLGQIIYSIYVGGDAWEWWGGSNRYIAIAMPMAFIILSVSINYLYLKTTYLLHNKIKYFNIFLPAFYFTVIIGLIFLMHYHTRWRDYKLILNLEQSEHLAEHGAVVKQAIILNDLLTEDAKIAVVWAGIIPYFTNRQCIDLLGKNDRYIANLPMRTEGELKVRSFYPGHMKYDYQYSIGKLQPDAIASLWKSKKEALTLMQNHYFEAKIDTFLFYFRKDSKNIKWDKINIISEIDTSNIKSKP